MAEVTIKPIDESDIDTILAEDIDFTGELNFTKPLMIKGKFKGEIKASGDLYIGEKAEVEAQIEANLVSLRGRLKGNISASTRVELFSTSSVEGDITTPNIIMESGSQFNGICTMRPDSPEKGNE
ncbi:MAG: polymer-forming cytoskeletal protein [Spirochaetota bacterium]